MCGSRPDLSKFSAAIRRKSWIPSNRAWDSVPCKPLSWPRRGNPADASVFTRKVWEHFSLAEFYLRCTSNFATADLTARIDSSTPIQIRGDITFGSDGFRRWLTLPDPSSAKQQEHARRLSLCERYRGIIGIQSQENRSI